VINLATKAGIAVEEREVDVAELKTANETFLTATNKDITPIVQIDDQIIGGGTPGPLTRQLMALFSEFVKKY
jgi:branched-subunit amino acid aminotransferase/4-amino-4-deoxychorismate lyase